MHTQSKTQMPMTWVLDGNQQSCSPPCTDIRLILDLHQQEQQAFVGAVFDMAGTAMLGEIYICAYSPAQQ